MFFCSHSKRREVNQEQSCLFIVYESSTIFNLKKSFIDHSVGAPSPRFHDVTHTSENDPITRIIIIIIKRRVGRTR